MSTYSFFSFAVTNSRSWCCEKPMIDTRPARNSGANTIWSMKTFSNVRVNGLAERTRASSRPYHLRRPGPCGGRGTRFISAFSVDWLHDTSIDVEILPQRRIQFQRTWPCAHNPPSLNCYSQAGFEQRSHPLPWEDPPETNDNEILVKKYCGWLLMTIFWITKVISKPAGKSPIFRGNTRPKTKSLFSFFL